MDAYNIKDVTVSFKHLYVHICLAPALSAAIQTSFLSRLKRQSYLPDIDGEADSRKAITAPNPFSWATALLSTTNFLSIPRYLLNSLLLSSSIL